MQYDPAEWIIAESEHYYIKGFYERAVLFSKANDKRIADVGDFYGDPESGIIDVNEQFCVTFGCGYVIYHIIEPFEDFRYGRKTSQWIESGNDPDNVEWIKSVRQISDTEIEFTYHDDNKKIIKVTF